MKITFFSQNLGNYISGGRQYPWHMAHCLALKGHKVTLATNHLPIFDKEFNNFPGRENIEIIADNNYGMRNKESIKKIQSGELFMCSPMYSTDLCTALAKSYNKKVMSIVLEPMNMLHEAIDDGIEIPFTEQHEKAFRDYTIACHKSDYLLFNNKYCLERAKEWFPQYPGKMEYLYNSFLTNKADEVRPKKVRENAIVFIGRTVKYKGYGDLLYIFAQTKIKPKIYYISGFRDNMDPQQLAFFKECEDKGLEIEIMDKVNEKKKFQTIAKCKALFMPSRFEGFGIPPAEAFYMNTPVVCYDLPVTKEIYGAYPHYMPFGDVDYGIELFNNLFENKKLLNRDLKEAKEHVKNFASISNYADRLEDVVKSFLNGKSVSRSKPKLSKIDILPKVPKEKKKSKIVHKSNVTLIVLGKETDIFIESLEQQTYRDYSIYHCDGFKDIFDCEINTKYIIICRGDIKLRKKSIQKLCMHLDTDNHDFVFGNCIINDKKIMLPDYSREALCLQPNYISGIIGLKSQVISDVKYRSNNYWEFLMGWFNFEHDWHNCREILYSADKWPEYSCFNVEEFIQIGFDSSGLSKNFDITRIDNNRFRLIAKRQYDKCLGFILFRDPDFVLDLLDSINYEDMDIVCVNHSPEGKYVSKEIQDKIRSHDRVISIEEMDGPYNYSKMNNYVFKKYGLPAYKYYVLMNDDLILNDSTIHNLIAGFKHRFENVGVIGSKLLFPNSTEFKKCKFPKNWTNSVGHMQHCGIHLLKDRQCTHINLKGGSSKFSSNYIREVDAVTFALVAIDADCYDSIKLNEDFPHEFNDVDFCIRAAKREWEIIYNPLAVAFHHQTFTRNKYNMAGNQKDKTMFTKKYRELLDTKMTYQELRSIERLGF